MSFFSGVKDSFMIPPFLKPGDTIGICATARWLTPAQLAPALDILRSWGYVVKVDDQVYLQQNQLAGSDGQRTAALQCMMNDPSVRAILIARGGYGTVRVVDGLDWSGFLSNPKWIVGYSDITVLHGELARRSVASIHSIMPVSFPDGTPEAIAQLKSALSGGLNEFKWPSAEGISGECQGELIGGNLSVLYGMIGSPSMPLAKDKIVFLEDVDEMLYHVDRMLMGLKRAGFFEGIAGVVAGGFTQIKDNTSEFGFKTENPWGASVREIIMEHLAPMQIPIAMNMPAGHLNDNRAFYMGIQTELSVNGQDSTLAFDLQ